MILGNLTIKEKGLIAENFCETNLQPASYDLRIDGDLFLDSGEICLVSTKEYLEVPEQIAGLLKDKSSYLRRGITIGQGFVDPGFKGNLTVLIQNNSDEGLTIKDGTSFCQIVFAMVLGGNTFYDGHYQNSRGVKEAYHA